MKKFEQLESLETSWRITDTPSLPTKNYNEKEADMSRKYHHYETIENGPSPAVVMTKKKPLSISPSKAGDPEIKLLYRELRPGSSNSSSGLGSTSTSRVIKSNATSARSGDKNCFAPDAVAELAHRQKSKQ